VDLYPGEVYADIEQAYADDLIEPFMISWEDVQEAYAECKEVALGRLRERYYLIADTVAELSWWACFTKEPKTKWRAPKPLARPRLHPQPRVRETVPKWGALIRVRVAAARSTRSVAARDAAVALFRIRVSLGRPRGTPC
jgi:hypothetical protein